MDFRRTLSVDEFNIWLNLVDSPYRDVLCSVMPMTQLPGLWKRKTASQLGLYIG
jgi:hypothetical protein